MTTPKLAAVGATLMLLSVMLLSVTAARADVRLPAIISDGMVLQQGMQDPIWGWADNGEAVTVKFQDSERKTTAGPDGKWMVKLPPMKASGPSEMTVSGRNTLTLPQVYVGEVWVCSGQSNMGFALRGAAGSEADIAASANPMIRLFTVPDIPAEKPVDDIKASWKEAGPSTTPGFSAVAYYFGRELQKALNVPVGLIHTSWGGTDAELWLSRPALEADPTFASVLTRYQESIAGYPQALARFEARLPQMKTDDEAAITDAQKRGQAIIDAAAGKSQAEIDAARLQSDQIVKAARAQAVRRETPPHKPRMPSELYNGMIAPLIPFAIRGATWYQGENNAGRAFLYKPLLTDLINDWRKAWGEGDFPFLIVQLAPFQDINPKPVESAWAELRDAQLQVYKDVPKVGLAVITDVGEEKNIHPKQKEPVGARLAIAARAIAYGEPIVDTGPVYQTMKVEGNNIVLTFKNVGKGLEARGGDLTGFAICGPDHKWVWGKAVIEGDHVVVSSPDIANPVAVRYGWANFPVVNLWNKDGLPASPFRTDDFPEITRPLA